MLRMFSPSRVQAAAPSATTSWDGAGLGVDTGTGVNCLGANSCSISATCIKRLDSTSCRLMNLKSSKAVYARGHCTQKQRSVAFQIRHRWPFSS